MSGGFSEDHTLVEMFPQASHQFSDSDVQYLGNSMSDESFRRIEEPESVSCWTKLKGWMSWLLYPLYLVLYYALCCCAYSRKDNRKEMKNPLNMMAKQFKMPFKKKKNKDDLVTINAMLELLKNSD